MNFSKATVFKIVLPLVFALSLMSGSVALADNEPPTPPTATAVELNTFGSLPVVILNLTQSTISFTMTTNSAFYTTHRHAVSAGGRLAWRIPGRQQWHYADV